MTCKLVYYIHILTTQGFYRMKKYSITNIAHPTVPGVHRIIAERDIPGIVSKGTLGGYVQSEDNLSHEGTAWVSDDAIVMDNAQVYGHAEVSEKAWIRDNVRVFGLSSISGTAHVCGDAEVFGTTDLNAGMHYGRIYNGRVIEKVS